MTKWDQPRDKNDELIMYFLFRGDLTMPPGKAAVQVGHAVECLAYDTNYDQEVRNRYDSYMLGSRKKIVLRGPDEDGLRKLTNRMKELRVPHTLVTDAGLTVFDGPTLTVLGVGPVWSSWAKPVFAQYKTYR